MNYIPFITRLKKNAEKYGERQAYRVYRGGRWLEVSWKRFLYNIGLVASALLRESFGPDDFIALYAPNCPEWTEIDYGAMAAKVVTVTIHAACSKDAASQILEETRPRIVFVGSAELADTVFEVAPDTERAVIIDGEHPKCQSLADFLNVDLAADWDRLADTCRAEDLWTIVYTSGTTGEVRGAMLTYGNLCHQIEAHRDRLPDVNDNDASFCMLPLSHVFERGWSCIQYSWGMTYNYCKPSPEVVKLLPEAKPAVILVVPRILEKIYSAVYDKFAQKPKIIKKLIDKCVEAGCRYQEILLKGENPGFKEKLSNFIADQVVFKKIRAVFGGHIKHLVVGSASLTSKIHEFFRASGIFINNGYGLTETTATVSSTLLGRSVPGTVGLPMDGMEIRLGEDNEIQVKGPNVMQGYYKKPEATKSVFTEDGFFRTGDVGVFEPNGYLRITDRIKDLIRTSTGKYVAPQYLESRLAMSPLIEQAAVVGEGRSWVGALLVPNFAKLEEYAERIGFSFSSWEDLAVCPEIISFVKKTIDDLLADVAKHERVQRIALLTRPFTIQAGELTPTFKLRRRIIMEHYRDIIAAMDSWEAPKAFAAAAGAVFRTGKA